MAQCAGASAINDGAAMQTPETPTTRTTLLTLPIHACTTFGSSLPACALAIAGRAHSATAASHTNFFLLEVMFGSSGVYVEVPDDERGFREEAARVGHAQGEARVRGAVVRDDVGRHRPLLRVNADCGD